jgi:hypothetical protein
MPTAVAVDSTGALYVADGTAGIVFNIAGPESSTTPVAIAISHGGTQTPAALAVDFRQQPVHCRSDAWRPRLKSLAAARPSLHPTVQAARLYNPS